MQFHVFHRGVAAGAYPQLQHLRPDVRRYGQTEKRRGAEKAKVIELQCLSTMMV